MNSGSGANPGITIQVGRILGVGDSATELESEGGLNSRGEWERCGRGGVRGIGTGCG